MQRRSTSLASSSSPCHLSHSDWSHCHLSQYHCASSLHMFVLAMLLVVLVVPLCAVRQPSSYRCSSNTRTQHCYRSCRWHCCRCYRCYCSCCWCDQQRAGMVSSAAATAAAACALLLLLASMAATTRVMTTMMMTTTTQLLMMMKAMWVATAAESHEQAQRTQTATHTAGPKNWAAIWVRARQGSCCCW